MKKFVVILVYCVLALGTLLVYWQVRNFDFVSYDDIDYVTENSHVSKGLSFEGIVWAFTSGHTGNWYPVTWLSLMLDCQMFGKNPGMIHFTNLLLHIINTLLLFWVLKKMTGCFWPSAFVAAAFAVHPMHVESVAWIAERKDVLSTLFLLLTLGAYAGHVKDRRAGKYLLTLVLFLLGLLTKPMLVTLPFLLLLLDYWPLGRFETQTIKTGRQSKKSPAISGREVLRRVIVEKIPFFVLSAGLSVVTFWVQRAAGAVIKIDHRTLQSRVENAFLSYTEYISKMFWPKNMAVFYPFDAHLPFRQVMLCVLLLVGISIFVIYFGRKRKYLPVGWFWFVGTLVPVIGLVQVGLQSYADRYTYISYTGLFIMIAWGVGEFVCKWRYRKIALGAAAVVVFAAMGIVTCGQVSYWKNSFTLFTHTLEVTQNNYVIYYNLGVAYGKLGRWLDAVECYKQAAKIKADDADTQYNLGVAYGNLGRWVDAIESYKQAIRVKPDLAEAYFNAGCMFDNLDRYQEAMAFYKDAIKISPDFVGAHYNLGINYLMAGEKGLAFEEYKILKNLDAELANKLFPHANSNTPENLK